MRLKQSKLTSNLIERCLRTLYTRSCQERDGMTVDEELQGVVATIVREPVLLQFLWPEVTGCWTEVRVTYAERELKGEDIQQLEPQKALIPGPSYGAN